VAGIFQFSGQSTAEELGTLITEKVMIVIAKKQSLV
jgi:hypothetical protein